MILAELSHPLMKRDSIDLCSEIGCSRPTPLPLKNKKVNE